jgi:hypothetical protein
LRESGNGEALGSQPAIFARLGEGLFTSRYRLRQERLVGFYRVPETIGIPTSDIAAWNDPANTLEVAKASCEVDLSFRRYAATVQQNAAKPGFSPPASNLQ